MNNTYCKMYEPLTIGDVEIKNRIVMAPMGVRGMLNKDGSFSRRAIDYYIERAKGGVGLIITTVFMVDNQVEPIGAGFPLVTPALLAPLSELVEVVHTYGAKIFVQLSAGFGRVARPVKGLGIFPHAIIPPGKPVSASANPYLWDPSITCRAIETSEVEHLVEGFRSAVLILAEAEVDGVELHGHEGYLFDQFTSSLWNQRNDKYGGSLYNRLRFPIEVLNVIKNELGQNFPVQYRFGLKHYLKSFSQSALPGENYVEKGRNIDEGVEKARILEKAGFNSLHVDAGSYEGWYWAHPPVYQKHGCMIDMAAIAKEKTSIPIIAVGRLDLPQVAADVINSNKADMVALGRGLLADPNWPNKVKSNKQNTIRPCLGCYDGCIGRTVTGRPLSCAVNPSCGREAIYKLRLADKPKKIIVIGGGIAGLEFARVASIRGHIVSIVEKTTQLGGHIRKSLALDYKEDTLRLLNYYVNQLNGLPVEIVFNCEVDSRYIDHIDPDVVVFATGSKPASFSFAGDSELSIPNVFDVLAKPEKVGKKVAIVGGGLIGCEIALWLSKRNKVVKIIEKLDRLFAGGKHVPIMTKNMLLDLLKYNGVEILIDSSVLSFKDNQAVLINKKLESEVLQVDTLINAIGLRSDRDLFDQLHHKYKETYLIGDALKAKNIMHAIWSAYEIGRNV